MESAPERLKRVQERIQAAARRSGRDPQKIALVAVTKSVSFERVVPLLQAGVQFLGENRVQEAQTKYGDRSDRHTNPQAQLHLIGHLQTNKAKKVADHFRWVQCLDSHELAQKLNQVASKPIAVLVEVKLHEEPNKSGIDEAGLPRLLEDFREFPHLELRGLMAIPPFFENPEGVRPYFRKLHDLAERFELPELSMGMSHDFEVAIEEGATMVRIGSALFGERS